MMHLHAPDHSEPAIDLLAAESALIEAGLRFTLVDGCPHVTCAVCGDRRSTGLVSGAGRRAA